MLEGQTIDMKNVKSQCVKLRSISNAYMKFQAVDGSTQRSKLTPEQEKDVATYIDLIVSGFADG